jgi:2-polyprenyl-3-methyl-5-hydroxy-6-metoxy-1,4-benzoquinol methylase
MRHLGGLPLPHHPLFFVNLKERSYEEELMDRLDADPKRLKRTIEQFDLLNRLFSSALALFKREILPTLLSSPNQEWTILDFGSGGGDIDRAVVRLCRKKGLRVRITALDLDPRVLPWAQDLCRDYPEITPVTGSVFDLPSFGDFDFIVSNHVLHHFTYPQVRRAVELCLVHARHGFLLNDLARSFWAYVGYTIFTGLFVRGSLAFFDGRLSIRRGFTVEELERELAGLSRPVRIARSPIARVYLT